LAAALLLVLAVLVLLISLAGGVVLVLIVLILLVALAVLVVLAVLLLILLPVLVLRLLVLGRVGLLRHAAAAALLFLVLVLVLPLALAVLAAFSPLLILHLARQLLLGFLDQRLVEREDLLVDALEGVGVVGQLFLLGGIGALRVVLVERVQLRA